MRKVAVAASVVVAFAAGAFTYRTVDTCSGWQERYKRVMYSDFLKIGPVVDIEGRDDASGDQPIFCPRPDEVSPSEAKRYAREGITYDSIQEGKTKFYP
jgi:hypothetical protein